MKRLKKFQKCISEGALSSGQVNDIQLRLFPYLHLKNLFSNSGKFWPTHTRWTGDVYENSKLRFHDQSNIFLRAEAIEYDNNLSFWENWLYVITQEESRGVVISVGKYQVAETIRLIRVLRHLKNQLPIQIVHKSDLSKGFQDLIVQSARENESRDYPGQELWFLDVGSVLTPEFHAKFKLFSNKWLAVLLCSFEKPILLDSDTVPFTSLEMYYETEQFQNVGSVFFKDRKLTNDLLKHKQVHILKNIVGALLNWNFSDAFSETLTEHLDDNIAQETLENLFIKRYKHHMESGLVLIDKKRHFTGLLAAIVLHFSSISTFFHGDKEWFWFGQLVSDEKFTFHPQGASNIGRLGSVVFEGFQGEFYQICSSQLSHTDLDGSLLWLNGGLSICKKNCWKYDYDTNKRIAQNYESVEQVRDYYQSPVELEGAIIPDVDLRPWVQIGECAGFSYCSLYKEGEFGTLIKFSEHKKQNYTEIIKVWNLPI